MSWCLLLFRSSEGALAALKAPPPTVVRRGEHGRDETVRLLVELPELESQLAKVNAGALGSVVEMALDDCAEDTPPAERQAAAADSGADPSPGSGRGRGRISPRRAVRRPTPSRSRCGPSLRAPCPSCRPVPWVSSLPRPRCSRPRRQRSPRATAGCRKGCASPAPRPRPRKPPAARTTAPARARAQPRASRAAARARASARVWRALGPPAPDHQPRAAGRAAPEGRGRSGTRSSCRRPPPRSRPRPSSSPSGPRALPSSGGRREATRGQRRRGDSLALTLCPTCNAARSADRATAWPVPPCLALAPLSAARLTRWHVVSQSAAELEIRGRKRADEITEDSSVLGKEQASKRSQWTRMRSSGALHAGRSGWACCLLLQQTQRRSCRLRQASGTSCWWQRTSR